MTDYGLRLGPLRFVTAINDFSEVLGDQLDQVGPVVVAGDRRARPFNLTVPVRAADSAADQVATGKALRHQVRQLMDNRTWRSHGLPLMWDVDPDSNVWLMVGGAELEEIEDGLTFGEWRLKLSDCYLAGRPGTHRAGRRMELADRRTGLVARDTLGRIFNTDYSAVTISTQPLVLPGEGKDLVGAGGKTPTGSAAGSAHGGVSLFQTATAINGEVVTYETESTTDWAPETSFPHDASYRAGAVRLWDSAVAPSPGATTTAGDRFPDGSGAYGWIPVLGPVVEGLGAFAIDNGLCRIRWAGFVNAQQLVLEGWDTGTSKYVPQIRLAHATMTKTPIVTVVEASTERVVVQVAVGPRIMRVILQRGWSGPRIESYLPGGNPTIDLATVAAGGSSAAAAAPNWVREIFTTGSVLRARAAQSHAAVSTATSGYVIGSGVVRWTAAEVLAVQFTLGSYIATAADLAAISLVDAQAIPVLTER
jgi:hypothetical protein